MPGRLLSRRTTLGSALVAPLVLAACDIDPPPRSDGTSTPTPEPPADSALVATVVAGLVRAGGVLEAARTAAPGLAALLDPLVSAHEAHLAVLVGAVPESEVATTDGPSLPRQTESVLRAVQRSEQRLLREVRTGCLEARSGDLARVLASVAASTSQHAAALATGVAR